MDNIKKVHEDGIYQCIIPLKGNPLKAINIYVIKSNGDFMIIDTGFNTDEIREYIRSYIKELEIDLKRTKLFITHLHADHTGQVNFFEEQGVEIIMGSVDGYMANDFKEEQGEHWTRIKNLAVVQGLGVDNVSIDEHAGYRFRAEKAFNYTPVDPGDFIKVGEFNFEVIDLAGHTPGMCGLYDREREILFCGDHILQEITPNIQFWSFEVGDSLGTYFKNLEIVKDMNIKHLYSSHRSLIEDVPKRVDELLSHHKIRLEEAYHALDNGPMTVRDVTAKMKWDITAKTWNEFPNAQKWFAVGEGHAHLEHLRAEGLVDYEDRDGIYYYYQIKRR